ncbi:hypothetical protein IWZ03DRAFT_400023 [Phyllosticta citriasiana]|uniref:Uncharacterized protein n=1 Tax=Phyllosticta citriasiana TaxID=595635 RepID=A0ABR1KK01_9PEZI
MPSQSASIQSYFSPQPSSSSSSSPSRRPSNDTSPTTMPSTKSNPGDGFTASERTITPRKPPTYATNYTQPFAAAALGTRPYTAVAIASLAPSSAAVTFVGRVVNAFHFTNNSSNSGNGNGTKGNGSPRAATGCLRLVLRGLDGTGLVTVRLWYADVAYPIRLGGQVGVWTTHVGLCEDGRLAPRVARLCASVFPERDKGCHVQVVQEEEGERGVGEVQWRREAAKAELMTLEAFARKVEEVGFDDGMGEVVRVVVCVKSAGVRKKVTRKDNTTTTNLAVHLFDNTATEATLTLWDFSTHSAAAWTPGHTILLLTNPGHRSNAASSKLWLTLTSTTTLDVDPPVRDAFWLRAHAARMRKKSHINPPFPIRHFTTETAEEDKQTLLTPINRVLYTLASLDAFARRHPHTTLTGYLSVLLAPLNLVSLHQRGQLFSGQCARCNCVVYANTPDVVCPLNPRILGAILDETGCVASGKLIWRDEAWTQLFGLCAGELARLDRETLRALEARCYVFWV